ncbi:MAG: hypothetical protein FWE37_04870 [Spirochaetaceae bacterium]|nr:hypothetical protein [Spirochaetaceae bacterium]
MNLALSSKNLFNKNEFSGFMGLFVNIVTNFMVMASLMIGIGIPAYLVVGRMLPAVGLGVALGNFYWAWFAKRTAKKTGNPEVCALPFGPSVGHMFVVTFVVANPVMLATGGNYMLAWGVALAWCFLEGIVEIVVAPFARTVRSKMPRAAMLGNAAGLSLTLIAMAPIAQMWGLPYIGIVGLGIAVLGFLGKKKFPLGMPVAVWMVIFGVATGWITGFKSWDNLVTSFAGVGFGMPYPAVGIFWEGLRTLFGAGGHAIEVAPILISAIPLGIANAIGTLNNLESAAAAGDNYPEREALLSDGALTIVDVLIGGPFPTTIYIGHPGYKEMGARTSYSVLTGIAVLIVTWFALIPVFMALIPVEAIFAILIFIALTIGSQAFQASPKHHYPAIILAMMFWLSSWVVTIIQNSVQAVRIVQGLWPPGPPANPYILNNLVPQLGSNQIFYPALLAMSQGHVMTAATMAMIVIFIIDKKLIKAVIVAALQVVLSFFGFIHAGNLGINAAQNFSIAYLMMGIVILLVHLYNQKYHPEPKEGDNSLKNMANNMGNSLGAGPSKQNK